jgi:hypothetical protein
MAQPSWLPVRVWQWIKPRSLGLHLAFVLIAGGCLVAAWWQVHRAMAGNTLSYLYSIEWPAFAVVAGIGWWQMVHDTPEDIARRRAYHERMRRASAEVVARTLPRSATALTVGSVVGAPRAVGSGERPVRALPADTEVDHTGKGELVAAGAPAVPGAETRLLEAFNDLDEGDELAEYNRYLATLAVRGRPKTWRNPRGL